MPAVMEQIDRMTTEEKFKTLDYIKNARGAPHALFIPRRIRRQVVIGRQRLMCIWKGRKTNE